MKRIRDFICYLFNIILEHILRGEKCGSVTNVMQAYCLLKYILTVFPFFEVANGGRDCRFIKINGWVQFYEEN